MFRGTFYMTIAKLVLVLTGFLLHTILGRWLGPEQFGIFGIINSFIVMLEFILLASIARGVSKFIAEDEDKARTIINAGFKIQSVIGIAIFCIFFFGADLIANLLNDPELSVYFKMFSFLIPIAGFAVIYEFALNGVKAFGRQAIIMIIFHISRLIATLFFVYIGLSVKGAIMGLILSDIIRLLAGRYFCKDFRSEGDFPLKQLITFSLHIGIYSVAGTLLFNIDLIAVKVLLKENLFAGLYTSAQAIARMPWFIAGAISMALFPLVSRSISEGDDELTKKYLNQTLRYVLAICIPFSFLINATSQSLLPMLFGQVYADAATPLNILIFGMSFMTINTILNTVILASERPFVAVAIGMVLVLIDIILNIFLVPKMGINGAAWAATITGIAGCVLSGGYLFYRFNIRVNLASAARILLSSIIVYFIATLYLTEGFMLFANYIALSIVFFVLLIILGEFTIGDIMNLKGSILKKLQKEKIAV